MSEKSEPGSIRIDLSPEQQQQVRTATGREVAYIELTMQELEARIAPRLAGNHNEMLLTA
jgi:hypothetical protein